MNWNDLGAALTVVAALLFVVSYLILRVVRWSFTAIKEQREDAADARRAAVAVCTNHISHNTEVLVGLKAAFEATADSAVARTGALTDVLKDIHNHVHTSLPPAP